MKTSLSFLGVFTSLSLAAHAAIQIPGADGSSGVLNITENTTIDLSLAADGAWDDPNTANGIYDASQWAVVFNYSSVNIDPGVTLTFSNHPSRAPVVWLVSGDVTIGGNLNLSGSHPVAPPGLAEPGPGGFRGGMSGYVNVSGSPGLGIGGGARRYSAAYGIGWDTSIPYGNPSLIPLIGGSGGGGDSSARGAGGGAGGGAMLIACAGTVTCTGNFLANGGNGRNNYSEQRGAGSGGGIRIVCDTLAGAGKIEALGGTDRSGGPGRIRLERVTSTSSATITPDPSIVPLATDDTALLWPPPTAPRVEVVSIGGLATPSDPRAAFGAAGADVALPQTSTTPIVIRTTHVEQASTVKVRVTPRSAGEPQLIPAAVTTVVSPTEPILEWTAELPVGIGYSAVQVHVVRP